MNNYFFKPELEDLSQGARLKFVRELRYKDKKKVAMLLNLGGENPTETLVNMKEMKGIHFLEE